MVAVATLTGVLTDELRAGTAEWIGRCQTYEGGLGGEPGLEAHGGYTFCGAAALSLLGRLDALRARPLLSWLSSCQKRLEGGFHGRTNKLVDGCYAFWQGAAIAVAQPLCAQASGAPLACADGGWLFDQTALQDYLLICAQPERGGMRDKPGKEPDFYHTCYCLSGLAVAQHSGPPSADGGDGGGGLGGPAPYGEQTRLVRRAPACPPRPARAYRALRRVR